MKKKIIVCYFASIVSLLGFTMALNTDQIPIAVLMAAISAGCMVWFTDMMRHKRKPRRVVREDEPQNYRIDIPLDDEPEDETAGGVRPGSRQSVTYDQMKAAQETAT
ncbi:hypothetical protein [Ruminococcus sp.]|uniref:hypothetical protein n=1 Tax=Ruminococcus sp. TaxID=41978 RepID=UPI00388DE35C